MDDERTTKDERQERRETAWRERFELLVNVSNFLEPIMVGLGIVFLGLLLMEFAGVPLEILGQNRLADFMQAIWLVFLGDFLLRLVIAPDKAMFLRSNVLGTLSLVLPFLRPLRAFRAARALRGFSLVRLLGGINRGMRALRRITRGRLMLNIAALTVAVVLAGAVGVQFFDSNYPDSPVRSFEDALWWSATLVTTMNSELYVVSAEAKVIALLQRLYALSVFGYITASIASYLVGVDTTDERDKENASRADVVEEMRRMRAEIESLRVAVEKDDERNRQGDGAA